jgi:hypothetical protein
MEAAEEALQRAKKEELAQIASIAEKEDILTLAEAILLRKEEARPTAQEMRVLREAIDVVQTAAAEEKAEEGTPIEVLDLGTRIYNILDEAGISTVEDILAKLAQGDEEMLDIKGFGPKSLDELKEKLQAEGFVPAEDEVPIEVLDLSTRVYNCLEQAGITTVERVLQKLAEGEEEVLAIEGFGPKSLLELNDKLQAAGLVPAEEAEAEEPEEIEAVAEEPVEAVEEEEVVEAVAAEAEAIAEVAEEAEEAVPAEEPEEEVPAEEVAPAEEAVEEEEEEAKLEKEEEELYEYEEEEDDELDERRAKRKKRRLVYDEELGEVVAKRRRKPGRRREDWEDYY